jgi:dynactin complex subunit
MDIKLNDLFLRFLTKGFMPIEIPELVKDVLDIVKYREPCTMTTIDQELEELGWGINIMDNATYELITSLVEGRVS